MHTVQHAPTQGSVGPAEHVTVPTGTKPCTIRDSIPASRESRLIEAATNLGALFDRARVRANAARASVGWSVPISVDRQVGEHCYYAPGQHGKERTLSLFIVLPLVDGDLFGGAYIKAGGAHSIVYVVPVLDKVSARWIVQASGTELTASVVDDLFLNAFSDDADAARRLVPLYGLDLFVTPWS